VRVKARMVLTASSSRDGATCYSGQDPDDALIDNALRPAAGLDLDGTPVFA
jgi:hypothetical protein